MADLYDKVKIKDCHGAPELNGSVATIRHMYFDGIQSFSETEDGDGMVYVLWEGKECLGEFSSEEFDIVASKADAEF